MKHEAPGGTYHDRLKMLMDEYAHLVYSLTKTFPKSELYGLTSQFRRSALSIVLNYVEGYARARDKVHKNFLEISYGSLKEARYLGDFSFKENLILQEDYKKADVLSQEIGAMLWGIIIKL